MYVRAFVLYISCVCEARDEGCVVFGRRRTEKWNPLLLFYRSAKLPVSLGAKYSNWENCASDCINSLLQFHLNPLKSHQPSVH